MKLTALPITLLAATLLWNSAAACGPDVVPPADAAAEERPQPATTCLKDVCFPAEGVVGGETLPALGVARMRYWGFLLYTAALYACPENANAALILEPAPRRLVISYARTIEAADLVESTKHWMAEQPGVDMEALRDRIDAVCRLYKTVHEGDRYTIEYDPAEGTHFLLNGRKQGTIPGDDFARAYFGIWLSENCLDDTVRDRLMGATD